MELEDIVSVSGLPGLHKLKSKTPKGFIVQSLETENIKFITDVAKRLIPLDNITIYTDEEEDIELEEVFQRMVTAEDELPPVSHKADSEDIKNYFTMIVPEHDEDQVYTSDMKKTLQWFHILREHEYITKADKAEQEESDSQDSESSSEKTSDQKTDKTASAKENQS